VKYSGIPFSGSRADTCGQTDRRADGHDEGGRRVS
jgi:hypothetical protein